MRFQEPETLIQIPRDIGQEIHRNLIMKLADLVNSAADTSRTESVSIDQDPDHPEFVSRNFRELRKCRPRRGHPNRSVSRPAERRNALRNWIDVFVNCLG